MARTRRRLLRAAGASIAGAGAVGAADSAAAAGDPSDRWVPAHYSNYSAASRGANSIRWLVLHTIEGSASAGINWFQDSRANVSSHFVVDRNGTVTKMVRLDDVAWTQGNSGYNRTGVSVEMEGHANRTQFTEAMYDAVADIARYVSDAYGVPKRHPGYDIAPCSAWSGRGGIIGHNQIPSPHDCSKVTSGKVDPGDTWDWDYFMEKVTGSGGGGGTFDMDQTVHATVDGMHTWRRPGTDSQAVAQLDEGTEGRVVNGPVQEGGYTWWGLHWESLGVWGWSVEQGLAAGSGPRFQDGDPVTFTADVYVRERPGLDGEAYGVVGEGSDGYVVNGPVEEDGYTWWGMYVYGYDLWAWAPEDWLAER